jgi:hypothetical protein
MPIAKEDLVYGFSVIAREGTYVPQNVVDEYGFKDKVEADKKRSHRASTTEDKNNK